MSTELFSNSAITTVLSGGTTAPSGGTTETWTVSSAIAFPSANSGSSPPTLFHIADPGQPTELIAVINTSGTTWTVTRGAESTTPVAHTVGFTIQQVVSAGYFTSVITTNSQIASGDLTGSYPSPSVAKINGVSLPGSAPTAGQYLAAASGTTSSWTNFPTALPPNGSAGGDLSGSYPAPSVSKIHGVSVSGTPSLGQGIYATGSTTASWGAIGIAPTGIAATDTANIQNAINNGGLVQLQAGTYFITGLTINPDIVNASLQGMGPSTVLSAVGAGPTVYMHRTAGYGTQFGQPADVPCGFIRDLIIDGTNVSASNAIGLDVGDGWGIDINNVWITNFTSTGAIALNMSNRKFWTEKCNFRVHCMNNTTAVVIDQNNTNTDVSHEYCEMHFYLFCNAGQNGVVVQNGSNVAGCSLFIRGNFGSTNSGGVIGNTAALTVTGSSSNGTFSRIYATFIDMKVESNQNLANTAMGIYLNPAQAPGTTSPTGVAIQNCQGLIVHSMANANFQGNEVTFKGMASTDIINYYNPWWQNPGSSPPNEWEQYGGGTTSSVPNSGQIVRNYGTDQLVFLTGGTITQVQLNGTVTGITTAGPYYVSAGGTIKVNYSGTLTWNWIPAQYSAF